MGWIALIVGAVLLIALFFWLGKGHTDKRPGTYDDTH